MNSKKAKQLRKLAKEYNFNKVALYTRDATSGSQLKLDKNCTRSAYQTMKKLVIKAKV